MALDDGRTWTGIILLVISGVVFVGGLMGAGAEVGLRSRGKRAEAEVLTLREEHRRLKGQTVAFWIARVRYRDSLGEVHEGDIDDCSEDERVELRPGSWTTVKYDPDHPEMFVWISNEER